MHVIPAGFALVPQNYHPPQNIPVPAGYALVPAGYALVSQTLNM